MSGPNKNTRARLAAEAAQPKPIDPNVWPMMYDIGTDQWRRVTQADVDRFTAITAAFGTYKDAQQGLTSMLGRVYGGSMSLEEYREHTDFIRSFTRFNNGHQSSAVQSPKGAEESRGEH